MRRSGLPWASATRKNIERRREACPHASAVKRSRLQNSRSDVGIAPYDKTGLKRSFCLQNEKSGATAPDFLCLEIEYATFLADTYELLLNLLPSYNLHQSSYNGFSHVIPSKVSYETTIALKSLIPQSSSTSKPDLSPYDFSGTRFISL